MIADEKITVHVKLLAKSGKFNDLLNALVKCAEETRSETGCEYSEILQNFDNPELITIVEKFTNDQAFKQHMQMPVLSHFIDKLSTQLTESIHVSFHITRVDCIGSIGDISVEELSYRKDLMDRFRK